MKNTIKVSSGFTADQVLDALARCEKNTVKECVKCPYHHIQCIANAEVGVEHDAAELIRMLMKEEKNEITHKVSSGFTVEQVLDTLDRCAKGTVTECAECPYRAQCLSDEATGILHDAAELIRMLMGESSEGSR